MNTKYEIIIFWDEKDSIFVADVPELPGCMAHGASEEEALKNIKEAILLWLEAAKENGESIPKPKGERLIFA